MKHHTVTLPLAKAKFLQDTADGAKLAESLCMKQRFLAVLLLLFLGSTTTWAMEKLSDTKNDAPVDSALQVPDIQPLHTIQHAVESFVLSEQDGENVVSVTVKDLDRRLRLAYCHDELEAKWSPGGRTFGRVTVQVQCASPKPWRVHVQATITMEALVWTLSRGVRRGDVLERDLLENKKVTLGANHKAITSLGTPIVDLEPWLGFVFAQRVNAGKVISERMLKPAKLVSKGQAVVIRHRSNGLELQTRGTALRDAGAREQTQVRNTSSGKIIDVIVIAPGVVDILN